MYYKYLLGAAHKPDFSQLRAIKAKFIEEDIADILVTPIYLTCWEKETPQQLALLERLLFAKTKEALDTSSRVIVLPRSGVQTSWSTKVLDILKLSNINGLFNIELGFIWNIKPNLVDRGISSLCYDAMTQQLFSTIPDIKDFFLSSPPKPIEKIDIENSLKLYNKENGLGLRESDQIVLSKIFKSIGRHPTDAELMMFAQVNSEHCRHRIFNGQWHIDNKKQELSLFDFIKQTTRVGGLGVLSAYKDNAAVIEGWECQTSYPDKNGKYNKKTKTIHHCIKVESHNHPTAIAPFEGAATGTGGETRDEGATGIGARPSAGMSGFVVGNLNIPTLPQPWETPKPMPSHATPLEIMINGPLGSSNYGNEFGRPGLAGFFRTLDTNSRGVRYASLKPIMLAGGIAHIFDEHVYKSKVNDGYLLVLLGGPSMRIGIGGGSTSSVISGSSSKKVDFSSVQRDNPEIERRCQQVIDRCTTQEKNPIAFIHDIGAGGLSNAFPELAHDAGLGARINLDEAPSFDSSLSPMEIWCNEAQERYAIAIAPDNIDLFSSICARERCPFAIIGETTEEQRLYVSKGKDVVVDMPMQALFGDLDRLNIECSSCDDLPINKEIKIPDNINLSDSLELILQCPSVASKAFLVSISDRSITGKVAGEPMIGPWQVPVSDCALITTGLHGFCGEAMAIGERTPISISNAPASARMAIGEAITNIASCGAVELERIKFSANWMASCQFDEQRKNLYDAVKATSLLCQKLGIAIPVGKDSLSMASLWKDNDGESHSAVSPLSLVITAYCRSPDVRLRLTPQLDLSEPSKLWFIDLASGKQRLGHSALAQVLSLSEGSTPDVEDSDQLALFVSFIKKATKANIIEAYHDRSDGGLWACLCEMAFASNTGLNIDLSNIEGDDLQKLANEELGVVIQVKESNYNKLVSLALGLNLQPVATISNNNEISLTTSKGKLLSWRTSTLEKIWSLTSLNIQKLRENLETASQEFENISDTNRSLLVNKPSFSSDFILDAPSEIKTKPLVAILREQGTNGHNEMAAAFLHAGLQPVDVHMSDLISSRYSLLNFHGLVVCGGFSYGDVLGGGKGWASIILNNPKLRDEFAAFFHKENSFSLGVCNGCQVLSLLSELMPDKPIFPRFNLNTSGRFEGRLVNALIEESPSVLLNGMHGSILATTIANSFGRVDTAETSTNVSIRYSDHNGVPTKVYPYNPSGSYNSIAGASSPNGRVTIMMTHPERVFLNYQSGWLKSNSYQKWHKVYAPWFKLFTNAADLYK